MVQPFGKSMLRGPLAPVLHRETTWVYCYVMDGTNRIGKDGMSGNGDDRAVLRDLAHEVAEIAALPRQQQTISLWKALNGLEPARPMVLIDQIPWHEMDVDGELELRTEDPFFQDLDELCLREPLEATRLQAFFAASVQLFELEDIHWDDHESRWAIMNLEEIFTSVL